MRADGSAQAMAIDDSRAQLRALADHLPHAMIYQLWMDPTAQHRRFTFLGSICERLNGVTREAAMADADVLYRLITPEYVGVLVAAEADALAHGCGFDVEVAMVRPDGERRWARISSAPRFLPDGSSLWDGIQLDITDSRRASDALATEQHRLEMVVEAAGLGLWDFDVLSGDLAWDDAVRAMYGMAPGVGVDHDRYIDAIHPDDREAMARSYREALESDARGYTVEHRTLGPDGVERWVQGSARILRDAAGKPVRVLGSTLDITERKRAEHRLELMVHELNHRVKNSMAVVQAIVRRTLRSSVDLPEGEAKLSMRLLSMARVHDLLTEESWHSADLGQVIARTLAGLVDLQRIDAAGPSLRLRPSAAVTLSLVFHELGVNALKYGALSVEGGRIAISGAPRTTRFSSPGAKAAGRR